MHHQRKVAVDQRRKQHLEPKLQRHLPLAERVKRRRLPRQLPSPSQQLQ
jgi:hypothetical protein